MGLVEESLREHKDAAIGGLTELESCMFGIWYIYLGFKGTQACILQSQLPIHKENFNSQIRRLSFRRISPYFTSTCQGLEARDGGICHAQGFLK